MALDTDPASWVPGEIPTAAKLNTEIRDAFTGIQAAWLDYTPTWIASTTAPAIGNGTLSGKYLRIGATVLYQVRLVPGSTTTYGAGVYRLTLPFATTSVANDLAGSGLCFDLSTGARFACPVVLATSTSVYLYTTAVPSLAVTPTVPFTWAAGDVLTASGTYEAA